MSMKKGKMLTATKFRTPEFRVSYPHLFTQQEASTFADGSQSKPSYNVQCLFPKTADLGVFDKAVQAVIDEKFGGKRSKKLRIKEANDGDEMETKDGKPRQETQGTEVISLDSKTRKPKVIDRNRDNIDSAEEVYGGCYAVAVIQAFGYDKVGKGVTFELLGVQKTRDGEPFQSGLDEDDFEEYDDPDGDGEDDEDGAF